MSAAKLFTEAEVRSAVTVGVGIARLAPHVGGSIEDPAWLETAMAEACATFVGDNGREVPNFEHFRDLMQRRDYGGIAHSHLAAAEMLEGQESMRHAALGQLAATIDVAAAVQNLGHDLTRP